MKIVCGVFNMFTRVPTFIPSSSNNEIKKVKTRNGEKEIACFAAATPESRRRRRTKMIRKRSPMKKSEVNRNSCNQLPIINQNQGFLEEKLPSPSYRRESRKSKISALNDSCANSPMLFMSPYLTRAEMERKTSSRIKMDEHDSVRSDMEHSDTKVSHDAEMLTHARLHKRNRRKFAEDNHHDIQSKRHAKNDCANLEERKIIGNSKVNSTSRLDRLHHHELEGGKSFRSKIPVRFPEIQENKRNLQRKFPQTLTKPDQIYLPPIYDGKNLGNRSEQVTQSIQDCRNTLEKDFQRLGENLENTFKLLHRYIEGTTRTSNND